MLLRVVAAITLSSALTGLLMVFVFSRLKASIDMTPELIEKRRKVRLQGSLLFWMSVSAFVFLISRNFTPFEVLFGLLICLAFAYPLSIIKGGLRLVTGNEPGRPVALAKDRITGENLGTIISQSGHGETIIYRIRTKQGEVVEKSADGVKIDLA
jgi:hypothetical protein